MTYQERLDFSHCRSALQKWSESCPLSFDSLVGLTLPRRRFTRAVLGRGAVAASGGHDEKTEEQFVQEMCSVMQMLVCTGGHSFLDALLAEK